jgi:hypothetical protein
MSADHRPERRVRCRALAERPPLSHVCGHGFNPPAFFVIRAEAFESGGPCAGLDDAIAGLGSGPFAVRSSARAEDGADHSHAGQFDTFLNVAAKDVWEAAKKVWRSGFSDTVATYRAVKTGGAAEGPPSSSNA